MKKITTDYPQITQITQIRKEGKTTEDRGQRTEDRGQRTEDR
jgi:hypothetical protein